MECIWVFVSSLNLTHEERLLVAHERARCENGLISNLECFDAICDCLPEYFTLLNDEFEEWIAMEEVEDAQAEILWDENYH